MVSLLPILLFAALMGLEEFAYRRESQPLDWRRIAINWGLGGANWALAALVPVSALLASQVAGTGLITDWPLPSAVLALVIARSLGTYWLHRFAHQWPALWQLHRLHHSDHMVDITTGFRSHPIEAMLSAALAAAISWALGASVAQVVIADAILFSAVIWHHAAIRLPCRWSAMLERVIVTPRFHRLHHSVRPEDHDRNYGDLLTIWDRLFGTLKQPSRGHFAVGLGESRERIVTGPH